MFQEKSLQQKWQEMLGEYEIPTVFKQELLTPFFAKLNLDGPVLDMGCGTGYFTELLAKRGIKIIGADRTATKFPRGGAAEYVRCEGAEMPFADHSFQNILLINVLSCIDTEEERQAVILEAKRMLKEAGKIFVINTSEDVFSRPIENKDYLQVNPITENKAKLTLKKIDGSFISFDDFIIRKQEIEKIARQAGLEITETKEFHDPKIDRDIYRLDVLEVAPSKL